jgi:hypothetical protein
MKHASPEAIARLETQRALVRRIDEHLSRG